VQGHVAVSVSLGLNDRLNKSCVRRRRNSEFTNHSTQQLLMALANLCA